jgi:hypothetical protein
MRRQILVVLLLAVAEVAAMANWGGAWTVSAAKGKSAANATRGNANSSAQRVNPPTSSAAEPTSLPAGAYSLPFENIEGAMVVRLSLGYAEGRDTSGAFVVDTGAGYLALAPDLLREIGLADSLIDELTFAPRPLRRLRIGDLTEDIVAPVLSVRTEVIKRVTDRDVLGLLGQAPLGSFALWIDYQRDSLALIPVPRDGLSAEPPRFTSAVDMAAGAASFVTARIASRRALGAAVTSLAVPLPFLLEADGKLLVRARLSNPTPPAMTRDLVLVLDTGATKSVLFEETAGAKVPGLSSWKQLRGLTAPTLYGVEDAYMTRIPEITLTNTAGTAAARNVDFAVVRGELGPTLSRSIGVEIDGLLGYSFLRRFRLAIDYPHRVLWLDPVDVTRDQRPDEYCHVGLQIERHRDALVVVAVAAGSPAEAAGIRAEDELVSIDGAPAGGLDLMEASRRLEGAPGSRTTLVLRRGTHDQSYRLTRRQLL